MTQRSVTHATFTIERTYPASPSHVFAAFAEPAMKARWFTPPEGWESTEFALDFRVGGREVSRGGPKGGPAHSFDARYQDIVPEQRIVFTYDMHMDETRISVSLATVEFEPEGAGTRLVFTEQDAFLDGYDNAGQREEGTRELLDNLAAMLSGAPATT